MTPTTKKATAKRVTTKRPAVKKQAVSVRTAPKVMLSAMRLLLRIAESKDGVSDDDVSALRRHLIPLGSHTGFMATFKELEADTPARHALIDQLRTSLLEFLKDRKYWGAPTAGGTLTISGLDVWQYTDRPPILLVTGPWPTPFWFATATLIEKTGHLLRHCLHCRRVFLRETVARMDCMHRL